MLNVHVGRTHEAAVASGRDGHDEFARFLAPYGRFGSYVQTDGSKVPFGFQPTLEDSIEQQRDGHRVGRRRGRRPSGCTRELLDLRHLCIFFDLPGLTRGQIDEQLELVADEVMPRLGVTLEPRPLPGRPM